MSNLLLTQIQGNAMEKGKCFNNRVEAIGHEYAKNMSLELIPYTLYKNCASLVQFSSVTQSCPTLCDPMNHSTSGLPVHH